MKKFFIVLASLLGASVAMADTLAAPLAAPTAFQIYPQLAISCMDDGPASQVYVTGVSVINGELVGQASLQGFVCKLRVHTGRGPGFRIVSACADVVWTPDGSTILSVTPISQAWMAYSIICS